MSKKEYIKRSMNPLIDKGSQLYLSMIMTLYLVVYTVILLVLIMGPSVIKFTKQSIPIHERFQASREFLFLDQRVVPPIILIMFIVFIHFLFVTHHVFGPLTRFRRILNEWCSGLWPQTFKIRPKDFHEELFSSFNKAADRLAQDFKEAREIIARSVEMIESVKEGTQDPGPAKNLEEAERNCREAISKISRYSI